ncbi:MAG: hypothetical protein ABIJ09_02475 [Pseudomonadota bacterium]
MTSHRYAGVLALGLALTRTTVASALSIGPDGFGYMLEDQGEEAVTYEWFDLSAGTRLTLGDNEASAPIALGFAFGFYGQTYDQVQVLSNGSLSFASVDEAEAAWAPGASCPAPTATGVDAAVGFYQIDFDPTAAACSGNPSTCWIAHAAGGVAPYRWFGLTFSAVPARLAAGSEAVDPVTVQVVLYETSNTIRVQVADAGTGQGEAARIGVAAQDHLSGLAYTGCLTSGAVPDESALVFTPPGAGLHVAPGHRSGWQVPGASLVQTFALVNLESSARFLSVSDSGSSWTVSHSAPTLNLDPGAVATVTVTVAVPASAAAGDADQVTVTWSPLAGEPLAVTVATRAQHGCREVGSCPPELADCVLPARPNGTPCAQGTCQDGACVPPSDAGTTADSAVSVDASGVTTDAASEADAASGSDATTAPPDAGTAVADSGTAGDAGTLSGDDSTDDGSCGCHAQGSAAAPVLVLVLAGLVCARRRRTTCSAVDGQNPSERCQVRVQEHLLLLDEPADVETSTRGDAA